MSTESSSSAAQHIEQFLLFSRRGTRLHDKTRILTEKSDCKKTTGSLGQGRDN